MSVVAMMSIGGLYLIGLMGYFVLLVACSTYMKSSVSRWWLFLLALGWPVISIGLTLASINMAAYSKLRKTKNGKSEKV